MFTTSIRARAATCALVALSALTLGGCEPFGGNDEDPEEVLQQTFNNDERISSGVLSISVEASAEGDQGGTFSATLGGPFQGDPEDPNALPQLDFTAAASGEGAGESVDFEGAVTVSEDNAFITYNDQAYEVGAETFGQLKEQLQTQAEQTEELQEEQGLSLDAFFSQFDVDPSSWLSELENEGTEEIEGESTIHIHGVADVEQIFSDLLAIGSQVPGAEAQGVSPEELQFGASQISQIVSEASIDVYGGEDDKLLRGLDLNLGLEPPEEAGVPVGTADLGLSVRITDVNQPQTIEAPTDAQPIDRLLDEIGLNLDELDRGGLGGLEGLGGGLDGGGGGGGLGDLDLGGGAGGANLRAYERCVNRAGNDAEKVLDCAKFL